MARLAQELRTPGFAHCAMLELLTAQLALEIRRFGPTSTRAAGGLPPGVCA
jgi:hypothetical protein